MSNTFSEEELALLQIFTGDREQGQQTWQNWRSRFHPGTSSPYARRQFSRVYCRLRRFGIPEEQYIELKPYYERNRIKSALLLRRSIPFIDFLDKKQIPVMVMKSLSLVLLRYERLGARLLSDIDLLIPPEHTEEAFTFLDRQKWNPLHGSWQDDERKFKQYFHASDLKQPGGGRLDLHWHVHFRSPDSEIDKEYWQRSRTAIFRDRLYRVFDTSDLFFHFCIHGEWAIERKFDWAIDIATLLFFEKDSIDWRRIVEHAKERRLVDLLRRSVAFLSAQQIALPGRFLDELSQAHISLPEKLEAHYREHGVSGYLGGIPYRVATILRVQAGPTQTPLPLTAIDYLGYSWKTSGRLHTLLVGLKKFIIIQLRFLKKLCKSLL